MAHANNLKADEVDHAFNCAIKRYKYNIYFDWTEKKFSIE